MIALRQVQLAKYLGIGVVALFLYFSMVKPAMRRAFPPPEPPAALAPAGRALAARRPVAAGREERKTKTRTPR